MGCTSSQPEVVAVAPLDPAEKTLAGEGASGGERKDPQAKAKKAATDGTKKKKTAAGPPAESSPKFKSSPPAEDGGGDGTSEVTTASSRSGGAASKGREEENRKSRNNDDDNGNSSSEGGGDATGYSSGASTPATGDDDRSAQSDRSDGSSPKNSIRNVNSVLGLNKMIEDRKKGEGDLKCNIVHIEVPLGKPIEQVYDGVHDGPVLGSGISGLVRLITHKDTGVKYAVKCLDLGLIKTEEGLQQLREEIYIMCQLDHPNIVRLEEVYESYSEIYLVQELCLGGELFDRLDEQPDYHYTEAQCARLVKQMLSAVRYIHTKGIIHRDLKLENFLFSNNNPDSELKMIDFGLSKHFKFGEVQNEAVGTPYTVAPEVIRGCYDERCDVWAIGVITFLLLSGDPPFGGCGGPEPLLQVRENILRGKFEFEPEDVWEIVSSQARDYIKKLLVTDPNKRPTAKEAQRSEWLKEWANRDRKHESKKLNPNVVKALVNFKEYSDMRKLLCEVLSFTLLPDQIEDLRREFEKLDTDGSGEICLQGLKQVLISNAGAGSLGALTETEVEDIFNAMRVRKTEMKIHWHEFIAAGLSQCKVDDRNLRLAFDRLDANHKGYITFENVKNLLGNDPNQSEDAMRRMWGDSIKACKGSHARITYEDFLLLMKGQTRLDPDALGTTASSLGISRSSGDVGMSLSVLHEVRESILLSNSTGYGTCATPNSTAKKDNVVVLPSGDVVVMSSGAIAPAAAGAPETEENLPPPPPPPSTPDLLAPRSPLIAFGQPGQQDDLSDGPLMMDEDEDDLDEKISEAADKKMADLTSHSSYAVNLTPPQSPTRGAVDYITPISQREKLGSISLDSSLPSIPSPFDTERSALFRRRSRSVDDQDNEESLPSASSPMIIPQLEPQSPTFAPDVRRAMLLPESNHNSSEIERAIKDETMTPLVVNRKLYRAHRQMRLSVMEASKRFEEQQIARTRKMLEKKGGQPCGAGLTMRRGLAREMSTGSIQKLMQQQLEMQQKQVNKAAKRGGRGRRTRKKTVSDMAGMLSSAPPGEILMDPGTTSSGGKSQEDEKKGSVPLPVAMKRGVTVSNVQGGGVCEPLRAPTTPGVFRKTVDPFAEFSGYQKTMGLESTSGAMSVIAHGSATFEEAASADLALDAAQTEAAAAAVSAGPGAVAARSFPKKGSDLLAHDASVHSMRSSASDGQLRQLDTDDESSLKSSSERQSNLPPAQVTDSSPTSSPASIWPPPLPL